MPEILLIDDDRDLTQLLEEYLSRQGHAVRVASDGREGLRALFEYKADLIALDVTMPAKDGWETLARIREVSDGPVSMLTAHGDESDVLRGFSLGADDYVTKPFSFAQLAARIHVILARAGKTDDGEGILRAGDLEVELKTRHVTRNGELIALTPTEFKLLTALMRRADEVMSPGELVREVWGVAIRRRDWPCAPLRLAFEAKDRTRSRTSTLPSTTNAATAIAFKYKTSSATFPVRKSVTLFKTMLMHFREADLLKARGQQRTDSTHVLAAIHLLNGDKINALLVGCGFNLAQLLYFFAQAQPVWSYALEKPFFRDD